MKLKIHKDSCHPHDNRNKTVGTLSSLKKKCHYIKWDVTSVILLCFVTTTLLVPVLFLNKAIFLVLFIFIIAKKIIGGNLQVKTLSPFIISLIFLYGFLLSLKSNSDFQLSLQFTISAAILFLIYIICEKSIDFDRIIKISGVIFCLATILCYFVSIQMPEFWIAKLKTFAQTYALISNNTSHGYFGAKDFFHFGSVPFVFLPACLFVIKFISTRKFIDFIVVLLMAYTIYISSSRALLFAFVAASIYLVYSRTRGFYSHFFAILLLLLSASLIIYLINNTAAFSSSDQSNLIKIGHITSFIQNMESVNFLFGEGTASYYYSSGAEKYIAHTEITPLDMIRYFGIPLSVILFIAIMFPVTSLRNYKKENKEIVVIFLIYIGMSMSNPTLFNSYGMLVVVWYWSKIINQKQARIVNRS